MIWSKANDDYAGLMLLCLPPKQYLALERRVC
jgi:hypothetical protein